MEDRISRKTSGAMMAYDLLRPKADQFKRWATEQEVSEPRKLVRQAIEGVAGDLKAKTMYGARLSRAAIEEMTDCVDVAIDLIMEDLFPIPGR